jgi:hypothetical protein
LAAGAQQVEYRVDHCPTVDPPSPAASAGVSEAAVQQSTIAHLSRSMRIGYRSSPASVPWKQATAQFLISKHPLRVGCGFRTLFATPPALSSTPSKTFNEFMAQRTMQGFPISASKFTLDRYPKAVERVRSDTT